MASRKGRVVALITAGVVLAAGATVMATRGDGGNGKGGGDGAQAKVAHGTTSRPPVRKTAEPTINAVQLRSSYETPTRVVSRDGGISVALPDGSDLWLFGDTGVFERTGSAWNSTVFIDGSTSMLAKKTPGAVPFGIELPAGIPERFLPVPGDVYLPDGSGQPCTYDTAAFPARWPIGIGMFDANEVIVTYSIVCVTRPGVDVTTRAEGWGYLLYNWKTRQIDQGPDDVFRPQPSGALFESSRIFGSPQVADGRITLFSAQCTDMAVVICRSGDVWSTTMPATTLALSNPASYTLTPLATDRPVKWEPLSASVGRYGTGLRLVEMTTIVGNYRIFTAPRPGAPWHLIRSGKLPGCPTRTGFCLALEGHSELSTATRTFVSYKDADSGPGGHIVISSLPT